MSQGNLINDIVGTYQKHGWQLRRVLLRGEVDGMWFSRPSHDQREAWELRLLAENPFALFETFEKDETEDQREEVRREMEARLRDYVKK